MADTSPGSSRVPLLADVAAGREDAVVTPATSPEETPQPGADPEDPSFLVEVLEEALGVDLLSNDDDDQQVEMFGVRVGVR